MAGTAAVNLLTTDRILSAIYAIGEELKAM